MSAADRIRQVAEQWFLTEPVLFAVYCSHRLTMNASMLCGFRTGRGRIEYNPAIVDQMSDAALRESMMVEIIRILLGHPYARQPLGVCPEAQHAASDMVIAPAYRLTWVNLLSPEDFGLQAGQHYEWYAVRLGGMSEEIAEKRGSEQEDGDVGEQGAIAIAGDSGSHDENADASQDDEADGSQGAGIQGKASDKAMRQWVERDYTALWEEDRFQGQRITEIVQSTTNWGMLPSNMVELIKKAAEGRIDYRNALRAFRASMLSQKRRLTRMRPSRRFGFEQMGSHYDFTTRLLIAIDTSGSVGSEELGRYYRVITTFFKYGIQQIDVLMFDEVVQGEPVTLNEAKKSKREFEVKGRGGTNFQAPIDYAKAHPEYDGILIITDGCAPLPDIPAHFKSKLLWVIDNECHYRRLYDDLRKTGRVCLMQL